MSPSIWQILIIAALALLFFGRGRISELMGDLGKGITSFKKGLREDEGQAEPRRLDPPTAVDHAADKHPVEPARPADRREP